MSEKCPTWKMKLKADIKVHTVEAADPLRYQWAINAEGGCKADGKRDLLKNKIGQIVCMIGIPTCQLK